MNADVEKIAIRVSGQFTSEESLKAINFQFNGRFFRLSDIAKVRRDYVDPQQPMFRYNGIPAIGLAISMTKNADALAFGEHVVLDLKRLEPAAWIFWQAVEDVSARDGAKGSNWGLIKADLRAPADGSHPIHITPKYWVMAQFSRFIRPGYRLVPVDDADTVGALSPDGSTLVLVHVNGGLTPRRLATNLRGWSASACLTDAMHHLEPASASLAPPRAVITLILRRGGRAQTTAKSTCRQEA